MKKTMLLFLTLTLFTLVVPALAAHVTPEKQSSSHAGLTRIEETEWKFRSVNGVLQKRLWSITYGVWRTGWINC